MRADLGRGMFLCAGILSGRHAGARARRVEGAMLRSQVAMLEHAMIRVQAAAAVPGHPEWVDDPRFAYTAARLTHQAKLKEHPTAHRDAAFAAAGVPCGPVRDMADPLADPHLMAPEMLPPLAGLQAAGNPGEPSGHAAPAAASAPARDQHRAALLAEFGA
jgi:crotonobetainyl-CoA:carnitine CoA-transferase CaiB-like acyl-CoA transferase